MRTRIEQRHGPTCDRKTRHIRTGNTQLLSPWTARVIRLAPVDAQVNLVLGLGDAVGAKPAELTRKPKGGKIIGRGRGIESRKGGAMSSQVKERERSSLADDPSGRAAIRAEHHGRWLAWSADGTRLVAVGETVAEVRAAAARAGVPDAILDWVPPADGRQVGRPE